MTALTASRAYWCPRCGRATPKVYRCQNYDCAADLAGEPLEPVEPPEDNPCP